MDDESSWTLEELVRRAGVALAGAAAAGTYPGAPNGRVREQPDQRVIRWYTTIGLVDRPAGGRGRGARYGPRHLRQLVAVKHLQAQGLPLAEIQAQLTGIADDELAQLAPLPPDALRPVDLLPTEPPPPVVLTAPPLRVPQSPLPPVPVVPMPVPPTAAAPRGARRDALAVTPEAMVAAPGVVTPDVVAPGAASPAVAVESLAGVRLAPGVLLLLPAVPAAADLAALTDAARPLVALLTDRGLVSPVGAPR